MKYNTAFIRRIIIASTAIILMFLQGSSTKDKIFTSGPVNRFTLQSTANGSNHEIKAALPANYHSSAEIYATIYVLDCKELVPNRGHLDSRNPNHWTYLFFKQVIISLT